MKKIIIILTIMLLFFVMSSFVLAQRQSNQKGQGGQQQTEEVNRGIEMAIQNLTRVTERSNNSEIGEQVRSMIQSHEKIQKRTKEALQQMDQRNQAVKLLIGPNYKNAGQVRSDVVGLRNDIKKLEQIKDKSLPADSGDIQGAIDELQTEATELESKLAERLSGFSLFGWLAKLFAD